MADTYLTLSQLTLINDLNAYDNGTSDLYDDAPVLNAVAATVASDGNIHKYIKQTVTAGAGFRAVNGGLANTVSTDVEVTVTPLILDASFAVDKAAADAYVKGPEEYIARESRRKLRAAMFAAECQMIGGTIAGNTGSASGFTGLADALAAYGDQGSDTMVINAGGTTAATGSSVYFIRTNDLGTDLQIVLGAGGNIKLDETVTQRIDTTDSPPKHLTAYYTPIQAWIALQVGSAHSVARIANLTADSGHTLTDALINQALALFPASRQPNMIVMGRRSLQQLQASRTSFNPTGAPAEIPNSAFNIPIKVSDACGVTEALLSS